MNRRPERCNKKPMMRKTALSLALSGAAVLASFAWVLAERGGSPAPGVESADANAPAGPGQPSSKKPADSLEFWLGATWSVLTRGIPSSLILER